MGTTRIVRFLGILGCVLMFVAFGLGPLAGLWAWAYIVLQFGWASLAFALRFSGAMD